MYKFPSGSESGDLQERCFRKSRLTPGINAGYVYIVLFFSVRRQWGVAHQVAQDVGTIVRCSFHASSFMARLPPPSSMSCKVTIKVVGAGVIPTCQRPRQESPRNPWMLLPARSTDQHVALTNKLAVAFVAYNHMCSEQFVHTEWQAKQ